jgi:hypothetical protein
MRTTSTAQKFSIVDVKRNIPPRREPFLYLLNRHLTVAVTGGGSAPTLSLFSYDEILYRNHGVRLKNRRFYFPFCTEDCGVFRVFFTYFYNIATADVRCHDDV